MKLRVQLKSDNKEEFSEGVFYWTEQIIKWLSLSEELFEDLGLQGDSEGIIPAEVQFYKDRHILLFLEAVEVEAVGSPVQPYIDLEEIFEDIVYEAGSEAKIISSLESPDIQQALLDFHQDHEMEISSTVEKLDHLFSLLQELKLEDAKNLASKTEKEKIEANWKEPEDASVPQFTRILDKWLDAALIRYCDDLIKASL